MNNTTNKSVKKIVIVYGTADKPIQRKAIELLSRTILDFTLEYPVCVKCGVENNIRFDNYIKIYMGTKEDNKYIAENSAKKLIHNEEYYISVKNNTVIIEGYDDRGVLWGCADFYNKYIVNLEYTHNDTTYWCNPLEDDLADVEILDYPKIAKRGIWTWGHVIYDYRSFIDNMVKLKMNVITIWNDHVPFNAKEITEYAHNAGIKVIWGYSWFWDVDCNSIDPEKVNDGIDDIIEKYEKEYLPLNGDGIYFQSFTELDSEYIGGVLIAEAVVNFVNNAADKFLKKYPDLELQFGLHANSVKEKLEYIKNIDPRVRIVWENCGSFPFNYLPSKVENFDATIDFVSDIVKLRGENERFGAVTKGLTKLKWSTFEHTEGSLNIGVSSKSVKENRILRKKPIWKYLQSYWMTNADFVTKAVKLMKDESTKDKSVNKENINKEITDEIFVSGLIEDGMFEEKVMFPAALYAEILWNPDCDTNKQINETALRNYVEFA